MNSLPRIFVSFSSRDRADYRFARDLLVRLNQHPLQAWVYESEQDRIATGTPVRDGCIERIDKSNLFVLLLSKTSATSDYVRAEIAHVLDSARCAACGGEIDPAGKTLLRWHDAPTRCARCGAPAPPAGSRRNSRIHVIPTPDLLECGSIRQDPLLRRLGQEMWAPPVKFVELGDVEKVTLSIVEELLGRDAFIPHQDIDERLPIYTETWFELKNASPRVDRVDIATGTIQRLIRQARRIAQLYAQEEYKEAARKADSLADQLEDEFETPFYYPYLVAAVMFVHLADYDEARRRLDEIVLRTPALLTEEVPALRALIHYGEGEISKAYDAYVEAAEVLSRRMKLAVSGPPVQRMMTADADVAYNLVLTGLACGRLGHADCEPFLDFELFERLISLHVREADVPRFRDLRAVALAYFGTAS